MDIVKALTIQINDELHKKLKIYAINEGETMGHVISRLVEREIETKKEQTQ